VDCELNLEVVSSSERKRVEVIINANGDYCRTLSLAFVLYQFSIALSFHVVYENQ
jgi:hypothetical protein